MLGQIVKYNITCAEGSDFGFVADVLVDCSDDCPDDTSSRNLFTC